MTNKAEEAAATKRGGARAGAGRKTVDGVSGVVPFNISLTPAERDKLKALGGSAWVREQLRRHP
ncbi:hypothetical protein AWB80_07522 [Caballeronia pedi]|uniref:Uncharacterized protein n=1 Tax=Caballeronia pedi TaxID=1777141 RepID=A0A158DXJ9_9BURK|nr:hypothetical protein [Caballeronia pedi]SAK98447.1 hypothetical protein AWB80_07522 [Caballeronia pedi]